jgi:hypothetical protein
MPESLPQRADPFSESLVFLRQGVLSAHYELKGDPRYYISAEPIDEEVPYAETPGKLRGFEELSGIKVVPHSNVVSYERPVSTESLMNGPHELDEHGRQKVLFHVAKKIEGIPAANDYCERNPELPMSEAALCVSGIVNFHVEAYKQGMSQGDVKPSQIMYGTVDTDEQPRLYMVDLDYRFFHDELSTTLQATLHAIGRSIEFILERRGRIAEYVPAARQILKFLGQAYLEDPHNAERVEEMNDLRASLIHYY